MNTRFPGHDVPSQYPILPTGDPHGITQQVYPHFYQTSLPQVQQSYEPQNWVPQPQMSPQQYFPPQYFPPPQQQIPSYTQRGPPSYSQVPNLYEQYEPAAKVRRLQGGNERGRGYKERSRMYGNTEVVSTVVHSSCVVCTKFWSLFHGLHTTVHEYDFWSLFATAKDEDTKEVAAPENLLLRCLAKTLAEACAFACSEEEEHIFLSAVSLQERMIAHNATTSKNITFLISTGLSTL